VLATSPGFSVSTIPQNWTCTFDSLLTGPERGFVVNDSWEEDSGVVTNLYQSEISEEVQYDAGTGCFAGVGTNNSGYLPANVFTTDTHGAPTGILTSPGVIVARQTSKFKDNRSGSADIPMKNSGYVIARICILVPPSSFMLTTGKVGGATTANGIASAAGV
jgi:hypothetical protein